MIAKPNRFCWSGLVRVGRESRETCANRATIAAKAAPVRAIVAALVVSLALAATRCRAASAILDAVGFDQNIGSQLPLDAEFHDEGGHVVTLGSAIHDRPAVLVFGYFDCPRLCGVVADGAIAALREIRPSVGRDFDFVYVSINPDDTPAKATERRRRDLRRYGRGDATTGWHFLTGDQRAIRQVTNIAGFRFQPAPEAGQFAHASGFIVVRPDGVISRYFLGIDFESRDVAAAIARAAARRNGQTVFDLLLLCFSESTRNAIVTWAVRVLRIATAGFAVALGFFIVRMLRREKKRAVPRKEEGVPP